MQASDYKSMPFCNAPNLMMLSLPNNNPYIDAPTEIRSPSALALIAESSNYFDVRSTTVESFITLRIFEGNS